MEGGGSVVVDHSLLLLLQPCCLQGFCDRSLFCNAILSVLSTCSFAIISLRPKELVALNCVLADVWLLVFCASSSQCRGPWVGLRTEIVAFPGHTPVSIAFGY